MNTRLDRRKPGANRGRRPRQVTVVFSPRGGAGQTVLATNLAVALAELTPDRVAILDLDLLFGHVAMLLDLVPRTAWPASRPAAIRSLDRDSLGYYMTKHAESSLRVMSGTLRPEESELVTRRPRARHDRAAAPAVRPRRGRCWLALFRAVPGGARAGRSVIVVSTPEPLAAHATQESQRVLRDLLGVLERAYSLRAEPAESVRQAVER